MRLVEIKALDNGAHNNQTCDREITIPEGWAIIPDSMECENFPFGDLTAEERFEIRELEDGTEEQVSLGWYVTSWTPGTIPEPEPEPEPEVPATETTDAEMAAAILEGVNEV